MLTTVRPNKEGDTSIKIEISAKFFSTPRPPKDDDLRVDVRSTLFLLQRIKFLRFITVISLINNSTPACSAGNCRSDPPPSPRLGGGCACYAGTSISVYPPPKSPSLEGDLLPRLKASGEVGIVAFVGFGGCGHDRFMLILFLGSVRK